jgi:hypothetical protein
MSPHSITPNQPQERGERREERRRMMGTEGR